MQSHNYTCFLAIERLLLVHGARWLLSASTWMSSKKETRLRDSRSSGELRVGHIYFSAIEWILNATKTIGMSANLFVKGLGWKSREQWPMRCHRFGQWPSTWGNENTRPPDRTTFSIPLSFCHVSFPYGTISLFLSCPSFFVSNHPPLLAYSKSIYNNVFTLIFIPYGVV